VTAAAEVTASADLERNGRRLLMLLSAAAISFATLMISFSQFGFNLAEKTGGYALTFILFLAMTSWLFSVLRIGRLRSSLTAIASAPVLACLYLAGYCGVDLLIGSGLPETAFGSLTNIATIGVGLVFCGLLAFQVCLSFEKGRRLLAPLQLHATNGFYVDVILRRTFGPLVST